MKKSLEKLIKGINLIIFFRWIMASLGDKASLRKYIYIERETERYKGREKAIWTMYARPRYDLLLGLCLILAIIITLSEYTFVHHVATSCLVACVLWSTLLHSKHPSSNVHKPKTQDNEIEGKGDNRCNEVSILPGVELSPDIYLANSVPKDILEMMFLLVQTGQNVFQFACNVSPLPKDKQTNDR